MAEPRFYLLQEMAERNGISFRALSDAARAGKLVTYKPHRHRLVTQEHFDDYMKKFRSEPERPRMSEADALQKLTRNAELAKQRRRSKE